MMRKIALMTALALGIAMAIPPAFANGGGGAGGAAVPAAARRL